MEDMTDSEKRHYSLARKPGIVSILNNNRVDAHRWYEIFSTQGNESGRYDAAKTSSTLNEEKRHHRACADWS